MKQFLVLLILFIGLPCMAVDISVIQEKGFNGLLEYKIEHEVSPKISACEFDKAYDILDYYWNNYSKLNNDKWSLTSYAEYQKSNLYMHWLYSFVGKQIYMGHGTSIVYGKMLAQPEIEKYMSDLYRPFIKMPRLMQQEYIHGFIVLGEKCINEGKLKTQQERDVYLCHCLYLLRATRDRQAYYTLSFHINNVSKLLVKEDSLYPHPCIKKFTHDQLNIKDGYPIRQKKKKK